MSSAIKQYIEENKERFIEELLELLRIPSVSADSKFKNDVLHAAEFVKEKLLAAGVDHAEVIPTNGHPVVYAEKLLNPDLPTILVYGHYDVQPADPYELWDSPPFEPVIRDGNIYARGSADDKGQFYMHVKAFEAMLNTVGLSCNVKFMIEGEEEVGSNNLEGFVRENKTKLTSDVILISDTSIISNDTPSITIGLKGLSYLEVEVTGPNRDLHSGIYGGGVANPVNVLCELIASLKDKNNRVTIPGFYDKVVELSADEREELARAPFNLQQYMDDLGLKAVDGEHNYSTLERTGIRPTLDVNGIWGGYIGEGAKTVLPSRASAKISMRLVPDQDSDEITAMFQSHIEKIAPETVKVKVTQHHGGKPYITPVISDAYAAASKAFEDSWGKKPVPTRDGGSIPIVALFKEILEINTVLLGFGLDSDAIHSPNEKYGIFNFLKGIETISMFHRNFAEMKR